MEDNDLDLIPLVCECHLVDWNELKKILSSCNKNIVSVEDLKKHQIIGHGCGQCLRTWECELKNLIAKEKF